MRGHRDSVKRSKRRTLELSHLIGPRFERRLCRRNRFSGGGFGRGAQPPSECRVVDGAGFPANPLALF
jgi:hypothetical protein